VKSGHGPPRRMPLRPNSAVCAEVVGYGAEQKCLDGVGDRVADSARKREPREKPAQGDMPRGFQILVAPITINAHDTTEELCARDWTVGLWERIAFGYQLILSRRAASFEAANRPMHKQAIPSRIENNVAPGNQPEGSRADEEDVIGTNPWKHAAAAYAQAN
jgi:hypothetical protein